MTGRAGALGQRWHRLRGLQAAEGRPLPNQERRPRAAAALRAAQGDQRPVRPLRLQVASVQLLDRCEAALGRCRLVQGLQDDSKTSSKLPIAPWPSVAGACAGLPALCGSALAVIDPLMIMHRVHTSIR